MVEKLVEAYGLYQEKGVYWLCQGRRGSNFVGLKGECPFKVARGMCNHLIPAAAPVPDRVHWEFFQRILKDPVTQVMLPVPKPAGQNLFFLEDERDDLGRHLAVLSRMSSPIYPVVRPIWMMKLKELEKELRSSNIQPLVLVQADQKAQPLLDTLARMADYSPRTVLVTGKPEVVIRPPFQKLTTELLKFSIDDLIVLPLESLGATVLRRFARGEELDAPIESRQDRRDRQIRERNNR
jgi:hypothetical protein